ncbi:hypothetical protein H3V53_01065 [Paraburkholderia bengalensis]|uniref:Uncharacterized protein n=1 Tax=Paraburkholderia bengalensis TaxID=2747562 RepID=A0ABU8IJS9_9BURK
MSALLHTSAAPSNRIIIALVCLVLAVVCGTGIAAFAGLLPASEHVAATITVAPLVDIQTDASRGDVRSID